VLMFRVLVLQTLYTLSDDQAEYQLESSNNLELRDSERHGACLAPLALFGAAPVVTQQTE